ncbi:MAG: TipAS antibiotic-recognition domain-containing protein [Eubacteriales bacterium]
MYAADQRFRAYFDKIRPGLADYVSEALKAHAASL